MDVYIYVCGCVHIYEYINKMQSTSNQKGDKVVAGSLFIYFFFLFIKNIYTYINVYSTSEKKRSLCYFKDFKMGCIINMICKHNYKASCAVLPICKGLGERFPNPIYSAPGAGFTKPP